MLVPQKPNSENIKKMAEKTQAPTRITELFRKRSEAKYVLVRLEEDVLSELRMSRGMESVRLTKKDDFWVDLGSPEGFEIHDVYRDLEEGRNIEECSVNSKEIYGILIQHKHNHYLIRLTKGREHVSQGQVVGILENRQRDKVLQRAYEIALRYASGRVSDYNHHEVSNPTGQTPFTDKVKLEDLVDTKKLFGDKTKRKKEAKNP